MVNEIKLCKDCEHYKESPMVEWCMSPYNGTRLTDGEIDRSWAAHSRFNETKCGTSAKWFVQKSKPMLESNQSWKPFSWIKKLW